MVHSLPRSPLACPKLQQSSSIAICSCSHVTQCPHSAEPICLYAFFCLHVIIANAVNTASTLHTAANLEYHLQRDTNALRIVPYTYQLPRGYSHAKFLSDEQMPTHATEVHRDVYSQQKIPKDIDAIVIGSGIGGLSCAGTASGACNREQSET